MNKKCAIYNRLTMGTVEQLKKRTNELIEYCVNVLKIDNYEVFEEICPEDGEREEFHDMMKKIAEKEFTDALTYDFSRYYRTDNKKLGQILKDIDYHGVRIHAKDGNVLFYIRKRENSLSTSEAENQTRDIGDYYCNPNNYAPILGYEPGVFAGMKLENDSATDLLASEIEKGGILEVFTLSGDIIDGTDEGDNLLNAIKKNNCKLTIVDEKE